MTSPSDIFSQEEQEFLFLLTRDWDIKALKNAAASSEASISAHLGKQRGRIEQDIKSLNADIKEIDAAVKRSWFVQRKKNELGKRATKRETLLRLLEQREDHTLVDKYITQRGANGGLQRSMEGKLNVVPDTINHSLLIQEPLGTFDGDNPAGKETFGTHAFTLLRRVSPTGFSFFGHSILITHQLCDLVADLRKRYENKDVDNPKFHMLFNNSETKILSDAPLFLPQHTEKKETFFQWRNNILLARRTATEDRKQTKLHEIISSYVHSLIEGNAGANLQQYERVSEAAHTIMNALDNFDETQRKQAIAEALVHLTRDNYRNAADAIATGLIKNDMLDPRVMKKCQELADQPQEKKR